MKILTSPRDQSKDTGMAFTLILLIGAYFFEVAWMVPGALIVLLLTMAAPILFKPLAFLWFGLAHILGFVMSRVILTLIFGLVVTPIGLLRWMLGADALQKNKWKKDTTSVFQIREGTIEARNLEKPF